VLISAAFGSRHVQVESAVIAGKRRLSLEVSSNEEADQLLKLFGGHSKIAENRGRKKGRFCKTPL
jgi:hypothetical protein